MSPPDKPNLFIVSMIIEPAPASSTQPAEVFVFVATKQTISPSVYSVIAGSHATT